MTQGDVKDRVHWLCEMEDALNRAGYMVARDVSVGEIFDDRNQKVHMQASNTQSGGVHFITLQGQNQSGTTSEKVPLSAMKLIELARRSSQCTRHYLVLYGNDWKLKRFYLNDGLAKFLMDSHFVKVVSIDKFLELANQGQL